MTRAYNVVDADGHILEPLGRLTSGHLVPPDGQQGGGEPAGREW